MDLTKLDERLLGAAIDQLGEDDILRLVEKILPLGGDARLFSWVDEQGYFWLWNVTKAKQIAAGKTTSVDLPLLPIMEMVATGQFEIDHSLVATANMTEPLVAIPKQFGGQVILIDGIERAYKKYVQFTNIHGIKPDQITMPTYVLSKSDSYDCLLVGPDKPVGG